MSKATDSPQPVDRPGSADLEPQGASRESGGEPPGLQPPVGRRLADAALNGGRRAASFLMDVFNHTMKDDVLTWSSSLAYTELFGLFPFLIFIRSILPYLPRTQELIADAQLAAEEALGAESELYKVLNENVFGQLGQTSTTLLSVSVVLALYSASSILAKMVRAINEAYEYPEDRSWIRRRLLGAALTVWVALFLPVSFLMIILGPIVSDALANTLPGSDIYRTLWDVLRWPLVLVLQAAGLSLLYRFGPSRAPRWRSVIPGSLVAIIGIAVGSIGFSWYLGSAAFSPSWLTYGVLGTAMVLLFWLYLVSASILVGGEVNGVVSRRGRGVPEERDEAAGVTGGSPPPK